MNQFSFACSKGRLCEICLGPDAATHRGAWRKKYSGVPEDGAGCNFTPLTVSAQSARPKPARAPFALVQARVAMPCTHRTADGRCALSKTCKGHCTCRTVAEWRDCPAGLWFVFVKTNIIHQPFNS